jgi:hypothetical protein
MLGFTTFSGSPISSVSSSVIYSQTINIVGEALFKVNANANWSGSSSIIGEAYVDVFGDIAGSGWTRINPDTNEWDYKQSSDWNKIN